MTISKPAIIVIIGISGDLSKRKLLPAISAIGDAGILHNGFKIIGVTRQSDISKESLFENLSPDAYLRTHSESLEIFPMDTRAESDYGRLHDRLAEVEKTLGGEKAERLFYLAVPPRASGEIIAMLGNIGFSGSENKLLLEKPFGVDLESAEELIRHIGRHFKEDQVYRIDHYLAKEAAQNILVFRESNPLFRNTWNSEYIERIDITASESIGIEGRGRFYEETGALRDIVQSHLMQLAGLTLMDVPSSPDFTDVTAKRLDAIRTLSLIAPEEVPLRVVRGQYQGYREEAEASESTVETFVSLTLFSNDPKWAGVPIRLTAGKALAEKRTEIVLHYKKTQEDQEANRLTLSIQPREGIEALLWVKRPGYERQRVQLPFTFFYADHFAVLPEAYEQVLIDALQSNHTLFTSSDEVLASWNILANIHPVWKNDASALKTYAPGTSWQDIIA